MGKKGNESKARRKELNSDSEKWISMLSIYWWEIRVTMLSNNIDSLHYLLPQIPVWTGKLSERTPQNHHIKLPVHLMCCWKKVPWCAVHCRLSSCSDLCPVGESHEFSLLSHVAKRFEKEYQSWSLGFWLFPHFIISLWKVIAAAEGIWEFGEFSSVLNLLLTSLIMHMVLGCLLLTQPSKLSGEHSQPRFHWCLMDDAPNTLASQKLQVFSKQIWM